MKSHKKDIFIRNQATALVLKVSKILRFFSSKSFLSSLLLEGDVKIIKRDNDGICHTDLYFIMKTIS